METQERLAAAEAAYLAARDARDQLDVARARGEPADTSRLEARSEVALAAARRALGSLGLGAAGLDEEDRRAAQVMNEHLDVAETDALPVTPELPRTGCADEVERAAAIDEGGEPLRRWLEACYGATAAALAWEGGTLSRLEVLARLAEEADPDARRRLFRTLEPLWHLVDGDGRRPSPYGVLLHESAARWRAGGSPIAANARALGVTTDAVETWAVTSLAAWRAAVVEPARAQGEPPVEPWDWWWRAGAARRALAPSLPPAAIPELNRAMHASLGADLDSLGVEFDLLPRPSRPPVAVAFTTFGARPHRRPDGAWSPGRPIVLASCGHGGLGELEELVHETGHAIHIAAIRTRPAFADWPDSDALTEALAEIVSLDLAEPDWQRRWLPDGARVPEVLGIRCRYADVVLDAAWALFEIRLHASPDRLPNDVWTEITSVWLGIASHPDWSWWAIRGQLLESPGYMANYAIGAVLAADLRAAIRAELGDWIAGNPGWYGWMRDHVYRFGLERPARDVLREVLGRPPTADALLTEIARGGRPR